jgi:fructokinase
MLPGGKQLGGAPTNFAYMASLLGDEGIVASRVGRDSLGIDARDAMHHLGLKVRYLQQDPGHPTGTAAVSLDDGGQPRFTITGPVAWDFLDFSAEWQTLAGTADVVCFGTLAQRSVVSRSTIHAFLLAACGSLRVFDVNLRQSHFSPEILRESLRLSHIVKLNQEELPVVAELVGLAPGSEVGKATALLDAYGLQLVCVTRGPAGSLLLGRDQISECPGVSVKVADAVGAGDAFTACLVHHYLRKAPLREINAAANRFAAWVASQPGGTPRLPEDMRKELLEK